MMWRTYWTSFITKALERKLKVDEEQERCKLKVDEERGRSRSIALAWFTGSSREPETEMGLQGSNDVHNERYEDLSKLTSTLG